MTAQTLWIFTVFFAVWAGALDWRYRRIPNWLTVTGLVAGLALNSASSGWHGAKTSLLGAGLGLLVLLPFVLLRALGAGDWKLVGALGAFLGPRQLADVLMAAVIVAGVMALVLVVAKGRFGETLRNMGGLLRSLAMLQKPDAAVSLDSPTSTKVPFGVAVAVAVLLYAAVQAWQSMGRA